MVGEDAVPHYSTVYIETGTLWPLPPYGHAAWTLLFLRLTLRRQDIIQPRFVFSSVKCESASG